MHLVSVTAGDLGSELFNGIFSWSFLQLRRQVLSPGDAALRSERTIDARGHAECRRAYRCGLARQHQDPGAGPAVARLLDLRHALVGGLQHIPFVPRCRSGTARSWGLNCWSPPSFPNASGVSSRSTGYPSTCAKAKLSVSSDRMDRAR